MRVGGRIAAPGDKSITHRALLLAGMSSARMVIHGALTGADARSSAKVIRQLGAEVSPLRHGSVIEVTGKKWSSPASTLNCGNSGTTVRLLLGALAGLPIKARLDGDKSLRTRPMRRVTDPLSEMGASFVEERGDGRLPLTVEGGKLSRIDYATPVASAQIKSAILLAGLSGGVPVSVTEPYPSRDHTERMLRFLGVDVRGADCRIELVDPRSDWPVADSYDLFIPGDPSSASFLIGTALLAEGGELVVEGVGTNPTRFGFMNVLRRMGGTITVENEREESGEAIADLITRPAQLKGTEVSEPEIPGLIDEIPILAVLAARAEGETIFRSVGELRIKESNRLDLIVDNLRRIGGTAEVSGDDLHVVGSDHPLSGTITTQGDHRITMAFAVLDTTPNVDLDISDTASSGVSYPNFFDDLKFVEKL